MPATRPLKIYAFDPTRGRKLNNYMTANVRYEPVKPGPVGEYLAVIDYDGANDRYYRPVDLDHPDVMIGGGLDPSESDPQFHQQMVYAVIMETIKRFEFALGRKVKWARDSSPKRDPYHGKLRIFPHGIEDGNAFYDPALRGIVFGYFAAGRSGVGANLPGQTVFTCLSHDIIVHETTHALIDGLREKFTVSTSADTAAFHEAFADIVALFEHFSYKEAVADAIERTGGYLYSAQLDPDVAARGAGAGIMAEQPQANPLIELARQFGDALGMRGALRSALGTRPDPTLLEKITEPHERGSILVAAVFDAFFSIYLARTRDLMRIGRANGAAGPGLHPDLTNRLAAEASKIAGRVSTICIRALDYCPPVDITFGEFLRALVTADYDLVPDDPHGYRAAFIEAFRARGIVPEDVTSYSEEALRWSPPEIDPKQPLKPCRGLRLDMFGDANPQRDSRNAAVLHGWASKNPAPLGLEPGETFQVFSFHPLHRVGPDGRVCFDYVVELLQRRDEKLDPKDPKSEIFPFYGGSTVILDRLGKVRYAVIKRIGNRRRLERQRAFLEGGARGSAAAAFTGPRPFDGLSFASIHKGY
jgi:hypothetical protein